MLAIDRIGDAIKVQPPTLDGILAIRGVVETSEAEMDEVGRAALDTEIVRSLEPPSASA